MPLLPWLSFVTVALAAVALVGFQTRRWDTAISGLIAAGVGATSAVVLRDQAFSPTSLVITGYGGLVALALIAGWWWVGALAFREGIDRESGTTAYIVCVGVGLVGARLGHVLLHHSAHDSAWEVLDLRAGGLFGYGGLLAGLVALWVKLRPTAVPWQRMADVAAPATSLGVVASWLGGYLTGGGFGRPLAGDEPNWLRSLGTFPHWPSSVLNGTGSPAFIEHAARGLVDVQAPASLPVHPTQLYSLAGSLALMAVVVWVRRRRRFFGEAFLALAIGYGALCFAVGFWRADPQRCLVGPIVAPAPLLAAGLLVVGVAVAVGPLRASLRVRWRGAAVWALALGVPVTGYSLAAGQSEGPVSLSQWTGLASVIAAAILWRRWEHNQALSVHDTDRMISSANAPTE